MAAYCPCRMTEHPKSKSTGGFIRPECSPCIYLRAADGHFSHRRGEECVHQQRTHAVRHSLLTPPSSLLVRLEVRRWALQLCPPVLFCLELLTSLILYIYNSGYTLQYNLTLLDNHHLQNSPSDLQMYGLNGLKFEQEI